MTARELYEYALIELNKLEAPSLLLEDYNYFINKAVQQYINLVYNRFENDQQSTDDLRVLKASTVLTPQKYTSGQVLYTPVAYSENGYGSYDNLLGNSYYVQLPHDYVHLINCIVGYTVQNNFKCYDKNNKVYFAARRLSSDMYTQILNNAYLMPSYKRPYYFVTNQNTATDIPTNATQDGEIKNNTNQTDSKTSAYDRNANASIARLDIRFGFDDTLFVPTSIYIDYLKAPQFIRLTVEQLNKTTDESQILEFPDYVCFEIVNIFTRLLMENASDPRLQTNMPINNTIITQAQQQAAAQQASK